MKVNRFKDGVLCYVAKLNRSSAALPQAVLDVTGTVGIDLGYLSGLYRLSDRLMINASILTHCKTCYHTETTRCHDHFNPTNCRFSLAEQIN